MANIPVEARMMAIADVYDALTSKRVYKEGYSHSKTCNIIKEGSGTFFDPDLISVFMEIEYKFKSLQSEQKPSIISNINCKENK